MNFFIFLYLFSHELFYKLKKIYAEVLKSEGGFYMADICVVGSNMIDLMTYIDLFPEAGETIEAADFAMGFGGKGANQAIAAARLGSHVNFVTMVGDDDFGRNQLKNYETNGINTEGIGSTASFPSGVASIFVDKNSENRILITKGANKELTVPFLESRLHLLKDSKIVVLQQEIELETNYRAIEAANEKGVAVLLNPAPANKNFKAEYIKRVNFLVPNESELSVMTGMNCTSLEEIRKAARTLVEKGAKNLFVTLGAKGVLWMNKQKELMIPALKVKACDTTGAGDAFIGSFAHFYASGKSIEDSLKAACKYAAITVTRRGTQTSYPTKVEFEEILKRENFGEC